MLSYYPRASGHAPLGCPLGDAVVLRISVIPNALVSAASRIAD
jgi:hypothetical protein